MGARVLLDTMGDANVWKAKAMLKLPKHYGLLDVTEYLLRQFHKTYPSLEAVFYPGVCSEVEITRMLVSHTYHHTVGMLDTVRDSDLAGWTRYCFGSPSKNKRDKNALVAHVPQSLNAMTLNKAYLKVFYDIAINPKYSAHFKLCAQIHDSILFQFRIGHEYLMQMVRERMEIPVTVKGYDGIIRTFTVPADVKCGKNNSGAYRWSETE